MIQTVEAVEFIGLSRQYPVIDVRTPGEFLQGHIPEAFNIPLFSNDERAIIGTLYHQNGRESALTKGLELALPKTEDYVAMLRSVTNKPSVLVHCWRGGMRSAGMAEVFEKAGLTVYLLQGGYKMYRKTVREGFTHKAPLLVLGGYTGTGKTEILGALFLLGEQVIDLEKLACHKGSVFGALGEKRQPTNEQFENDLYRLWSGLDFSKRIWIEDESRMIGNITLPEPIKDQISRALLIRIDVPLPVRIHKLVREYAGFPKPLLAEAIIKIQRRIGGARTKMALEALEKGRFESVAEIILSYYDKAYRFAIEHRNGKMIHTLELKHPESRLNATHILSFIRKTISHDAHLSGL